ncbi:hypothetical protein UCRPC4_g02650 [Phaeomoniella chlamydospora]|uniref:Uncharacterized protein n=1 Tax=Phaeomoniella chlamydospora TaxID=158046 RepID=A0A0G2EM61_PHACM|nr:hypothetical protein UCRPC4_g02650 [Phaeomoniella chlamydospora]
MVIRDITHDITTLSVPFYRFGRLRIGGRGTIVRLQSGSLAVFSPVALTPDVQARLQAYGNKVRYIAATDIEHHIYLGPWSKAYPEAELIGPHGLPEKREKDSATAGLNFKHVFTPENKNTYRIGAEFDKEFSYEYVHSHQNRELVFFHRPTGSLIQADLIFNPPSREQFSKLPASENPATSKGTLLDRIFSGLTNVQGDALWYKRFLWYAAGSSDRPAFAESVKKMDTWKGEMKRIIPCHGDVIEGEEEAGRVWDTVFSWYRDGKKSK